MKKYSKFWQGFLVAGIAALAVPSFVQGQSAGSGAAGSSSGMTAGSPDSTGTHSMSPGSSSGTSSGMTGAGGMTGSAATSGMSSSMGSMSKDMGSTEADKRLNSQIRQSLNADTSLAGAGRDIRLNTQDGRVTLEGSVNSEAEKNQIEQKVKQMSNVNSVKNDLRVAGSGSLSSMGSPSGSSSSMGSPSTRSSSTDSEDR